MREIKFRIWDKKNEIMYYGYEPNRPNMITFDGEICAQTLKGMDMYGNPLAKMDYYPQERFILMQYTGLKDAEGNEIYEGDIVVIDSPYYRKFRGEVIYDTKYGAFFAKGKDLNAILQWHVPIKYVKVIGNKWENPELLKEE